MPLPELEWIAAVRRLAGRRIAAHRQLLRTAIGDDCAVIRGSATEDFLVTTDLTIEGVHFRRDWHPPESVGHRCLARGLSDIAAMGGEPLAFFLSLGMPRATPQRWVDRFTAGLLRLASRYRVPLAGGDTANSPRGIVADILVIGNVPKGGAILRSGARPGDKIYATGEPGRAAGVLERLRHRQRLDSKRKIFAPHFFPRPRLAVGEWLRRNAVATAMIDLSDGISSDLGHICDESRVAAGVWQETLLGGRNHDWHRLFQALHGGEDYELLFTARPGTRVPARIAGIRVTQIGEIVARRSAKHTMTLVNEGGGSMELARHGWEHFRRRKQT